MCCPFDLYSGIIQWSKVSITLLDYKIYHTDSGHTGFEKKIHWVPITNVMVVQAMLHGEPAYIGAYVGQLFHPVLYMHFTALWNWTQGHIYSYKSTFLSKSDDKTSFSCDLRQSKLLICCMNNFRFRIYSGQKDK